MEFAIDCPIGLLAWTGVVHLILLQLDPNVDNDLSGSYLVAGGVWLQNTNLL